MEDIYQKDVKSIISKIGLSLSGLKIYSNIVFTWLYNEQEELGITIYSAILGDHTHGDSDLVIEKTKWMPDYYKMVKDRKFIILSSPKYQEWAKENGITTFPASGFWKVGHKVGKGIELEKGVWYTNIKA